MTADTIPKPCLHPRANHQHGSRECYFSDRCRCTPCRAANASYGRRRRKLAHSGRTPGGWVDAAPVRAHVAKLRAAGLGRRTIADRAGIDGSQIHCLMNGRNGRPPTARVAPGTARRLLAIPMPTLDDLAPSALVEGIGSRRRLQALVAAGWSQVELAERLGWSRENLYRVMHAYSGGQVEVATRRLIIDLYDQLENVRPAKSPRRHRALTVAATHGWLPPLAWDEDTIDDPTVRPDLGGSGDDVDEYAIEMVLDGQPMTLTGHDLEVAALALIDKGLDYAAIGARCRSDEATVRRVLNTARKRLERAAAREDAA